ncbi:MAG: TerB family tellurite resistance protein [Spirochaetales bacterium]|uniref:TerB family tellurite resistance protein n=1 Tax=Candidatus Thalassospirochaeta sargassi TaxID=3119039 RepID=A0AAJ1IH35_9SPIO|nr:TerB family tellurite resistance protein [Spirochaetales bacterium]
MSCLGAVIGGTIGLFLGGPLGAIAGAAFGGFISGGGTRINFGDQQENFQGGNYYSNLYGSRMNQNQRHQMTFFVGAFSMLAKIAAVDGNVSDKERRKVEEFMDKDLNLDASTKQAAFRIFDTAVNSQETFYSFANQFAKEFRYQPQMYELMLDMMVRIAVEDNGISAEEETLIIDAVHIFRLDDSVYARLKAKHTGTGYDGSQSRYGAQGGYSSSAAYAVLGCSQSDSDDKLKRAYRKLVSEYHPDKISAKGLPDEFQKVAKQKFIEIQNAWDEIKKERGL